MRQLALPRAFYRAGRLAAGSLSPQAGERASTIQLWRRFRSLGLTGRGAASEVGVSYATLCRWDRALRQRGLRGLDPGSRQPHQRRTATWMPGLVAAVLALREVRPRWGKDRLTPLLHAQGWTVSVSTVGRILTHLRTTGHLRQPPRGWKVRRPLQRPHATRKPATYHPVAPGDLVQLDTVDLRPLPGVTLKQFTAIDVVSRWNVLGLRGRATATTTAQFLDDLVARLPFPLRAIQVDGGSEFMAGFEQACLARGIQLFVLPPRSPKLNGCVERANRSHREEFWECYDGDLDVATAQLAQRQWEACYNTYRPHQALGWKTPLQYLEEHHSATPPPQPHM